MNQTKRNASLLTLFRSDRLYLFKKIKASQQYELDERKKFTVHETQKC